MAITAAPACPPAHRAQKRALRTGQGPGRALGSVCRGPFGPHDPAKRELLDKYLLDKEIPTTQDQVDNGWNNAL